ncbi:MAG: caspase family protein [Gammaproteobacteria bacterium]
MGISQDLTRITANAPPRLDPLTITLKHVLPDRARAVLRLHAQKNRLPMEDYTVFMNGIPITPGSERRLGGNARRDLIKELEIDLYQRENTVRVEVSSARSVGVTERYINVPDLAREAKPAPGNLYLLAVGVNRFPKLDAGWQLHYAAKDAIGIKHAFEELGRGLYKQVRSKILSDAEGDPPDKDRIVAALEFIKTARAQDTVVVFFSSHGLSDPEQNYYLVPRNALPKEIRQIEQGQGEAVPSLIGWETIFEALRNTAGRRLLIVDSCKAKSIERRFGAQWLKKRSASARFALMVSSKGTENSLEDGRYGHGIFTHALLQGLMTACDGRCEGAITLWRLFDYIVPTVNRLRALDAGQQTPQLSAPEELRDMVLARPAGSWIRELHRMRNYLRQFWREGN